MELELRSHRWTDATRRESRSLSSAGRGEALSGTRFTPLSPRSTRCFSHSSCARAHKRDRIWRENPARRFHVRDQNFLSGEVLCRAGAYADRTGQKWVVAVKTSLPVIDYRATFLIPRQFASFPFFLSYRMDRFIWNNNRVHGHKRKCTSPLWCSEKRYRHFVKCNITQTLLKSNFLPDCKKDCLCFIDHYW